MDKQQVVEYFQTSNCLAQLCTQNGWPDTETLNVEIVENKPTELVCAVSFEEILMEGSGCVAGRVNCWGNFRVKLDEGGNIRDARCT